MRQISVERQPHPDDWKQLASPSPWAGMSIAHFKAGPEDSEFALDKCFVLSHIRKAARGYESKAFGRWRKLSIPSGSLTFLPVGYMARTRWFGTTEAVNLFVDASWVSNDAPSIDVFQSSRDALYGACDKVVHDLLYEIYRDNEAGAPNGLLYSESLILAALYRLKAVSTCMTPSAGGQKDRYIDLAVEYIHANLDASLSIKAVAQAVGYQQTLSSFVRQFKTSMERPLHQYVLQERLERARVLLCQGKQNVTRVALDCGFNNLSHFSVAFKSRWGIPPSALVPQKTTVSSGDRGARPRASRARPSAT